MTTSYEFFLHGKDGMFPRSESIYAESDVDARHIAVKMLRDRRLIEWLEVWRDADLVFRLNRHEVADRHLS